MDERNHEYMLGTGIKLLQDLPVPSQLQPFSNTNLIRKKILEMEQHSSHQSSGYKKNPLEGGGDPHLYQLTYS